MKTNAIIRIVLFSIAILVLLGILLGGLSFGMFSSRNIFTRSDDVSVQGTITSSGSASTSGIRELHIEWVAGSISIQPGDVDTITFSESPVSDSKYQMVVKESGSKLTIQYCKDSVSFPSFGINMNLTKDLTVTVPRDWSCESLDIDTASATVNVRDLTILEMEFDGASGTCTFVNCNVEELDVDTASGDITFSGSLNALNCNAASASFCAVLNNTPNRIKMDTMSGDLDITLPADCGFTVSMDAMSSDFTSDFPTTTSNGNHIYGSGACRIDVKAMSGDVTIRKGQ